MKFTKSLSGYLHRWMIPALVMGMAISFSSCKKDEAVKPAPTVTPNPTSASGIAGAKVSTSVQVDSPEGGVKLAILVNGIANTALPDVTLDGTASQAVPVDFTIPAAATVGASYAITFQASDKKNQLSQVAVFTVTVSSVASKTIVEVTGNITTNTTWTADKIYRLNGFVRVGRDEKPTTGVVAPVITANAILTIEAGTVIYGKTGTPGGTLIVQRGSQIAAIGTAAKPIVFTSEKVPGSKKSGDWGGIVICGQAQNNVVTSLSTGTGTEIEELEGGYGGFHGGVNDADNSGTLKYVRIEYAGYPINPNQEINGLTLGSVGSTTTLQFIQATYSNDDSFEWFGGAVNASNLIAYKGIDDDFDTDNGFSGHVQFGLGIRDSNIADQSGSNGFECDNDAGGTSNTPVTSAQFSNMTIVGGKATAGTTIDLQFQNGAQIRRNAQQKIFNSFITAYPNGIYIDAALGTPGTVANATSGAVAFKNNILAGVDAWGGNGFGSAATAAEMTALGLSAAGSNHPNNPRGVVVAAGIGQFTNGAFSFITSSATVSCPTCNEQQISSQAAVAWFKTNNTILTKWTDSGLSLNVFEPLSGTPTLLPTAGSPLTTGADFTGLSGFTTVTYRGAFGSTDWTTGWVNWNPGVTDYSK